jgi:hypothetical protein
MRKNQFKNPILKFLGLFIAKKHDLSDKKISACHVPLPYAKFVPRLQPRP